MIFQAACEKYNKHPKFIAKGELSVVARVGLVIGEYTATSYCLLSLLVSPARV